MKNTDKATISIGGMNCASCAGKIEKALKGVPGVFDAVVNFASGKGTVTFDTSVVKEGDIKEAVESVGYKYNGNATLAAEGGDGNGMRQAKIRMIWAWIFTAPILLWMFPEMLAGMAFPNKSVFDMGILILAAPVLLWAGAATYRSALRSAIHGSANMDLLIALGTGASYITGIMAFFMPIANYSGVAAMIMSIHLTGRFIETRAKGRASGAIKKLLELGAKTAKVLVGGVEKEIPIDEVKLGDIMVIRPGGKIPTDGVIIEGESAIDESMATGESMPVRKKAGDEVIGATINQLGLLKVRASKIGKDTFLSQVIKMVEECQGSKVPIQAFADKVTAVFVPAVLVVAGITFISWFLFPQLMNYVARQTGDLIPWIHLDIGRVTPAVFATISVLVIACPCALGLATPTALMVGSGLGAENGILIREGAAIQTLKDIRMIVFDKTGTITKGKPEVTDVVPFEGMDADEVTRLAAGAESGSEHPLGIAIVKSVVAKGIPISAPSNFESISGKGIRAKVEGRIVLVGSRKLVGGLQGFDNVESALKRLEDEGKTAVIISIDGRLSGVIAVADTLKEDSIEAIKELKDMGIEVAMITGDNKRTAAAIAARAGISRVLSDVLPEGKVNEVKRLQDEAGAVAFVGDGINDAPALKQANVGIAIGTGTDIAIESSDVTLVSGNLSAVVSAVKLSRATFKKIKQNLFWAFGYNILAIPLAMLGLMHPVIAEIAMAASSISVVTNANRLKRIKI